MLLEFLKETAKLALIAVMLSFLLRRYLRWKKPDLATSAEERRMWFWAVRQGYPAVCSPPCTGYLDAVL